MEMLCAFLMYINIRFLNTVNNDLCHFIIALIKKCSLTYPAIQIAFIPVTVNHYNPVFPYGIYNHRLPLVQTKHISRTDICFDKFFFKNTGCYLFTGNLLFII